MKRILVLLFALLFSAVESVEKERLLDVKPENYDLTFMPNFENFTFFGSEEISVKIVKTTKFIEINCKEIVIHNALFHQSSDEYLANVSYDKERETATLEFENAVSSFGVLKLNFTGFLNDEFRGFSRIFFDDIQRYGAVTHFEPEWARKAFPCFDDPSLKATFQISVIVPQEMTALSNMPIASSEPYNENTTLKKVSFEITPPMSTYLAALAIGYYDYVERMHGEKPIRIYTFVGKAKQVEFAADVALRAIQYFEQLLDISYTLPKLDFVTIHNFTIGGMENWGLITILADAIIFEKNETSFKNIRRSVDIVAHEIAHQWTGNLVTMSLWSQIWLNEGFTSFLSSKCVFSLFPQWKKVDTTFNDVLAVGFDADGLESSHPIVFEMKSKSNLSSYFDAITYKKGESIIRMMSKIIGEKTFFKGLRLYLKRHQFGNAEVNDLWIALEQVSKKPIGEIMNSWVHQKNYPLVEVTKSQSQFCLKISQKAFVINGQLSEKNQKLKWHIPIVYKTASDNQMKWMLLSNMFGYICERDEIILNYGAFGFYRTKYTLKMYKKTLYELVKQKQLSRENRFIIQNDLFAVTKAGDISTDDYLKFLTAYRAENDAVVVQSIDNSLSEIDLILSNTELENGFHNFTIQLLKPTLNSIGLTPNDGDDLNTLLLRAIIFKRLGLFHESSVVKEAKREFEEYLSGNKKIENNLRQAVFCTIASNSNDEEFDALFELFKNISYKRFEVRNDLTQCIGYTQKEIQINKVLQLCLTDQVNTKEAMAIIQAIASSSKGRQLAYNLLVKDEKVKEKLQKSKKFISFIPALYKQFSSVEKAIEFEEGFKEIIASSKASNLETMRTRAALLLHSESDLSGYLRKFQ